MVQTPHESDGHFSKFLGVFTQIFVTEDHSYLNCKVDTQSKDDKLKKPCDTLACVVILAMVANSR